MELLSEDCRVAAQALRLARARLNMMFAEGSLPALHMTHVKTVGVEGLDVARALEALAEETSPKTPTPYDADVRQ